jgi:hypothetical protein
MFNLTKARKKKLNNKAHSSEQVRVLEIYIFDDLSENKK